MGRVVAPGSPHHVTQRGNRRMPAFFSDADYRHGHRRRSGARRLGETSAGLSVEHTGSYRGPQRRTRQGGTHAKQHRRLGAIPRPRRGRRRVRRTAPPRTNGSAAWRFRIHRAPRKSTRTPTPQTQTRLLMRQPWGLRLVESLKCIVNCTAGIEQHVVACGFRNRNGLRTARRNEIRIILIIRIQPGTKEDLTNPTLLDILRKIQVG